MMVVMSAFAANLNQENNQLQKKTNYIQAEVDLPNNEDKRDASNINKLRRPATINSNGTFWSRRIV